MPIPTAELIALQRSAAMLLPGRRLSPDLLAEVARLYRQAYAARRPVTEAVAEGTNCKPSTASKRIMAARKAGLLDDIPAEEARR